MNRFSNITLIVIGLILLGYIAGPKVRYDEPVFFDTESVVEAEDPEEWVATQESLIDDLKPGNAAEIVWVDDSLKTITEYSVVYLHGFSASHAEGDPVHREFARRYGCNLYLSRLEDHGRSDPDSYKYMTPDSYIQSAEEAIEIGRKIGNKVIVMACSTGATLATILAAQGADIHALIFYSPNIDLENRTSNVVLYPWGKKVASLMMGGEYNRISYKAEASAFWNEIYHTNGIFVVKNLIKRYMTKESFESITQPVFLGYYFKNEKECDKVVSIPRMLDFYEQISTPASLKRKVAFDKVGHHVISSSIMSKDTDGVTRETNRFAEEILGLKPALE